MRKIIAMICILSIAFGTTTVNAKKNKYYYLDSSTSSWKTYFGLNNGWYEGTEASLQKKSYTSWKAKILSMGWGGIWGGYVYRKIDIKKGHTYKLKMTLESTKFDKWVYVKIGNKSGSKMVYGKWVNCKKGKPKTINKKFKAKCNAKTIWIGFGGDFSDRSDVKEDLDANVRYGLAPNNTLDGRLPNGYETDHYTKIKCKNFSLMERHKLDPISYKQF